MMIEISIIFVVLAIMITIIIMITIAFSKKNTPTSLSPTGTTANWAPPFRRMANCPPSFRALITGCVCI